MMKYLPTSIQTYLLLLCIGTMSCQDMLENDLDTKNQSFDMEELLIPEGFNYRTSHAVTVQIKEANPDGYAKYNLYRLDETQQKELLVSGFSIENGLFKTTLALPLYQQEVRIERSRNGKVTTATVAIQNDQLIHTFNEAENVSSSHKAWSNQRTAASCVEQLYAVNGDGGFYSINSESGNFEETVLSNLLGGGSIACAVDRSLKKVYYNTGTTLRYYDIANETFHVVAEGNPFGGSYPRMEFNNSNGLLYIARNEKMYVINPADNSVINEFDIIGLQSPVSGGDVAISLDGTIYMCAFSGLYRIDITGNIANATRISAENLPFQPTSMAIDRNDRLFLATNDANSQLIEMDKFDGAWQVMHTYDHKINDLGSLPCSEDERDCVTDTDNDGIPDCDDEYPNDAEKAGDTYTPSKFGWGSLAFEDLWPNKGDYDFNDLVVNYRFIAIENSQNEVVELIARFKIRSIGGVLHSGFGFELPITTDKIDNVSGHRLTRNIVQLENNGLETGQNNAVIIAFDDSHDIGTQWACNNSQTDETEIIVTFTNPIPIVELGLAPFNPFIFIDGDRGREVHLSNMAPTQKVNMNYLGSNDDASDETLAKYYNTSGNLPWAINIIHDFRPPKENVDVTNSYNNFKTWAESGGQSFSDWYKDNSGFRNENQICDE
ncbi:MAG: LruC domain-containing protein [Bacteroidota bacterium]